MVRRRSMISAVLSTVAGILILVSGCSDESPVGVREPASPAVGLLIGSEPNVVSLSKSVAPGLYSAIIGKEGGKLDFGIGEIRFPKGSVSEPVKISARIVGRSLAVEFQPHGLQFPNNARPTLEFSWAGSSLPTRSAIVYVDDKGTIREVLGGNINRLLKTMGAGIDHFSAYTIATF